MQKFNWSTVIGCLVIAIAIIFASQGLINTIASVPIGGGTPSSMEIYTHDKTTYGDFLYEHEAANYLKVELETLNQWVREGKMDGTYTDVEVLREDENGKVREEGVEHVFSKAKLTEFMNNRIQSGN